MMNNPLASKNGHGGTKFTKHRRKKVQRKLLQLLKETTYWRKKPMDRDFLTLPLTPNRNAFEKTQFLLT